MNKRNSENETNTKNERRKDDDVNIRFKRQHHVDSTQEYNKNTKI